MKIKFFALLLLITCASCRTTGKQKENSGNNSGNNNAKGYGLAVSAVCAEETTLDDSQQLPKPPCIPGRFPCKDGTCSCQIPGNQDGQRCVAAECKSQNNTTTIARCSANPDSDNDNTQQGQNGQPPQTPCQPRFITIDSKIYCKFNDAGTCEFSGDTPLKSETSCHWQNTGVNNLWHCEVNGEAQTVNLQCGVTPNTGTNGKGISSDSCTYSAENSSCSGTCKIDVLDAQKGCKKSTAGSTSINGSCIKSSDPAP